MSIIKLTDPRYCSPLDPPLIPTYPQETSLSLSLLESERDSWMERSQNRETRNWDTQVIHLHACVCVCVVSPSIFDTRLPTLPAYELQNYPRISGIVPTCEAPFLPLPLSFSILGRPDNRLRSRKCRGARAWLISRG